MISKIAIIGTVGVPANYGGFETLAEHLIEDNIYSYTVYCSGQSYKKRKFSYKNAKLVYLPFKANGLQSIIYDAISIFHAILTDHKTLLVLGTSGAIAIKIVKLITKDTKIITNIDGIEWQREKWNPSIRKLLKLFESICIKNSDTVICDNLEIQKYVLDRYSILGEMIPYGGDHALVEDKIIEHSDNYHLTICRIEPENNIHTILNAFSQSKENIKIVGNWSFSKYGKNLRQKFSHFSNIDLIDPIYDLHKLFELRSKCKAYVHGHSAGGTNPSLIEMMHFNKPIILFDCSYNRSTIENQGFYFKNSEELLEILESDSSKKINVLKINEIANTRYTWAKIREQYIKLFSKYSPPNK